MMHGPVPVDVGRPAAAAQGSSPALWRVELLDAPAVVSLREPGIAHPLERKDAALFAILALDGPTARGHLATLLWPNVAEKDGRRNLRQRLFRLRRALLDDLLVGDAVLRLSPHVAVGIFSAAAVLDRDPAALAGDLLGPHAYHDLPDAAAWVNRARQRWRTMRADLLLAAGQRALDLAELPRAQQYAARVVDGDPRRESAVRLLMQVLDQRGDRAGAQGVFERLVAVLALQGREPMPETAELARRLASPQAGTGRSLRPGAQLRPLRLVGRATTWSWLERAWIARAPAVLLGGPGSGRSRVLAEFLGSHPGASIVTAVEGDALVPLALLQRLLARVVAPADRAAWLAGPRGPALAPVLAPDAPGVDGAPFSPAGTRAALVDLFRACATGGLTAVAVDDVQWADAASLRLLGDVAAAGLGLRWLFTRLQEADMPAALGWAVDESGALHAHELPPIDEPAVAEAVAAAGWTEAEAARAAPALHGACGGHVGTLVEQLEALRADGRTPGSSAAATALADLVAARLGRLPPLALQLAQVIALAGPDCTAAVAVAVLQRPPEAIADAWETLAQARLVGEPPVLPGAVRSVLLRDLPDGVGQMLRRVVAGALAGNGAPPARVAALLDAAGEPAAAVDAWDRAAAVARALQDPATEAVLLERVAASARAAGDADAAFRAGLQRVDALRRAQGPSAAGHAVAMLVDQAVRPAASMVARLVQANVALASGDLAAAGEAASRASRDARAAGDRAGAWDADLVLARVRAESGDVLGGLDLLAQGGAVPDGEPAWPGAQPRALVALEVRGLLLSRAARRAASAEAWQEAARTAARLHRFDRALHAQLRAGQEVWLLGRADAALAAVGAAEGLLQAHPDLAPSATDYALFACMVLAGCGRYADALAVATPPRGGEERPRLRLVDVARATLYLHLGQPQRARALLNVPALVSGTAGVSLAQAWGLLLQARLERLAGRSPLAWYQRLVLLQTTDDPTDRMRVLALTEGAAERAPTEAVHDCRLALQLAEARALPPLAVLARLRLAESLMRAGQSRLGVEEAGLADQASEQVRSHHLYLPEVALVVHRLATQAGGEAHLERGRGALRVACRQVLDLSRHVPDQFVDGFLYRNPINREILTRATRWLEPGEYALPHRPGGG